MPWLPMYLIEDDLRSLSGWLTNESDISLIQSVSPGTWKAFEDFEVSEPGRYCLFHSDSGPLPLLAETPDRPDSEVSDPFAGWKEHRAGADPNQPYFGAGHPAIFWLNIRLIENGVVGISSFEWIGNHYSQIGRPAIDVSKKWWERLRRWVKKQSFIIPRDGPLDGNGKEIWAFSSALLEFESGVQRATNP